MPQINFPPNIITEESYFEQYPILGFTKPKFQLENNDAFNKLSYDLLYYIFIYITRFLKL